MTSVAAPYTAADLLFSADVHQYRLPDGRIVPSVTQILAGTGVSTDFDNLSEVSEWLAVRIEERRLLGSIVHTECHYYDDNDLDWSLVDPRIKPFVQAWSICRANLDLWPITLERRIFHPTLFFCGTLDGIFQRGRSKRRILIDLKIGDPEDAAAQFQTAGYDLGWTFEHPEEPVDERWSVQLCPTLAIPYRVKNYTKEPRSWEHAHKFQAFVTTYHEQKARRRAA